MTRSKSLSKKGWPYSPSNMQWSAVKQRGLLWKTFATRLPRNHTLWTEMYVILCLFGIEILELQYWLFYLVYTCIYVYVRTPKSKSSDSDPVHGSCYIKQPPGCAWDVQDVVVLMIDQTQYDVIGDFNSPGPWDVAGVKAATQDHTLIRDLKSAAPSTKWSSTGILRKNLKPGQMWSCKH